LEILTPGAAVVAVVVVGAAVVVVVVVVVAVDTPSKNKLHVPPESEEY
jgi:hypothetical protein